MGGILDEIPNNDENDSDHGSTTNSLLKKGYYNLITGDKNITNDEVIPIVNSTYNIITYDGSIKNIINEKEKPKNNKFLGIIIVVLIAVFMTTLAELSQFLVQSSFNSPFMIIWFNTLFFLISFVGEFIIIKYELHKERKKRLIVNFNLQDEELPKMETVKERYLSNFKVQTVIDEHGNQVKKGITLKRLILISLPMAFIFVELNYIWMLALSMTQVSISTALYQSATVFCFIFSIIILKEKIKLLKTLSVLIFVGGIIGIGVATLGHSSSIYPHALTGDLLMILSAAQWALYEVLTNKFVGEGSRTILHTYMGLIAIYDLFFGIIVIAIFDKTGVEPFQIPDGKSFGMILLNAIIGYAVNYLINWGLQVTSPLFVRSGELMTIPATLVFDIIFKHLKLPLTAIPGYVLIVVGFIFSVFIESKEIKEKEKLEKEIKIKQQQQQIESYRLSFNNNQLNNNNNNNKNNNNHNNSLVYN